MWGKNSDPEQFFKSKQPFSKERFSNPQQGHDPWEALQSYSGLPPWSLGEDCLSTPWISFSPWLMRNEEQNICLPLCLSPFLGALMPSLEGVFKASAREVTSPFPAPPCCLFKYLSISALIFYRGVISCQLWQLKRFLNWSFSLYVRPSLIYSNSRDVSELSPQNGEKRERFIWMLSIIWIFLKTPQ